MPRAAAPGRRAEPAGPRSRAGRAPRRGTALPLGCALLAALLAPALLEAQPPVDAEGVDPAVLEENYCASESGTDGRDVRAEIGTGAMNCARLMELIFISRVKVLEHLERMRSESEASFGTPLPWKTAMRTASRGSSLLSAHLHITGAMASQRPECFSEHVRLLLVVNLRRLKALTDSHFRLLWLLGQDGPAGTEEELSRQLRVWLAEATSILDTDLRSMRSVLRTWRPPAAEEASFYSHEADGRYSTMEALRRDSFDEWQLDKGLLRGMLRHLLPIDATVGDFGAGSGHYSKWLNETGLVAASAFDGSPDVEIITRGAVLHADLGRPLQLSRRFDWGLCLDVAEHVPANLAPVFLQNLDLHVGQGLVISWARPGLQGIGSANPQTEEQAVALLQQHTGLVVDEDLTRKLRESASLSHLAASLLVLVRHGYVSPFPGAGPEEDVAPGCGPEAGFIYAGNDVQMYDGVASPEACCDLCSGHELCRFWSWSREESHKELCWIKSTREYRISHLGFISGSRRAGA